MNYLQQYQSFASKYELNEAVAKHLHEKRNNLNETDLSVLTYLSRHAVKYPGVAHLKVATIAEMIQRSSRTVRRSIEKLEQLHIIQRKIFNRRKTGGQGANLYIFLPFEQKEQFVVEQVQKTPTKMETKNFNEQFVNIEIESYYTRFSNLIKCYIANPSEQLIQDLYGIYRVYACRLLKFEIYKHMDDFFQNIGLQAITILFQTSKKKKIYNLIGYYDGIYRKLLNQTLFANMFMEYDVAVEFRVPENYIPH